MPNIFSDVQSGSSTTADIPYRYSDSEALQFVNTYGDAEIQGENDWWLNHNLSEYVRDKGVGWPPQGVIVKPAGSNMLVWFDTTGRLIVIDLSGYTYEHDIVQGVKSSEYSSDPKYLEMYADMLQKAQEYIPKPGDITNILYAILGIGIVYIFIKGRR